MCGKFADADRKLFGEIPDITDKGYIQNAFNIDVRQKIHPLEKVELEQDFPRHARGGFISYGELPKLTNNLPALEQIIDFAMKRTPYYGVNTPVDHCHECGFKGDTIIKDDRFTCPLCENQDPEKMTVIKRVSGYLGAPANRPFPAGKHTEMTLRKKNTV